MQGDRDGLCFIRVYALIRRINYDLILGYEKAGASMVLDI